MLRISPDKYKVWFLKDDPEDGKKFRAYVDHVAKERGRKDKRWKLFHQAAKQLNLDSST